MLVKYKDSSGPTILCTIGNTIANKTLFDLGESVNLFPYSTYKQLGACEMKSTEVILLLANRPIEVLKGEIEDVLNKIDEIIFLVDSIISKIQPFNNIEVRLLSS